MQAESTLSRVVVPTREVTIRGADNKPEKIEIRPFKFGQMTKVLKHVGVLMAYADDLGDIDIVAAFQGATEEIFELLKLNLRKEEQWLDNLEMDDGFALAVAMVEVNQDFFVQHVLPLISEYMPSAGESVAAEEVAAPPIEATPEPEPALVPEMKTATEPESLTAMESQSAPDEVPLDVVPAHFRTTGPA